MIRKVSVQAVAENLNAKLCGQNADAEVSDVTHDSCQVGRGSLFAAVRGLTVDGHRFIDDVMRRGAVGIISELGASESFPGAWLQVTNIREALAKAADLVHGNPSHHLKLVGITGTNGKTTTAYLCFALAEANGEKAAMLTTVEYRIGENSQPSILTTPEASDTNCFMSRALKQNCQMMVMETSSQALVLHRCDCLVFKVAIFMNLTRDHLDYHLTMENYFEAKKKLFDGSLGKKPTSSIINIDDEWGAKLANDLRANGQKVVTFAQNNPADFTAVHIKVALLQGTSFTLRTLQGERKVTSPLVGKSHIYNMLAATAASIELGYELDTVVEGLRTCIGARGRFERVNHNGNFTIIIDYAHSEDALLNTLKTAKDVSKNRIITVFGCGGDRDRSKRAPMGEIAGIYSDMVIITSDNCRTEDPLQIIAEIEVGLQKTKCSYLAILNRRDAIHQAIAQAKSDDLVLICGKGHETYQIVGNNKFHFDDREIALEGLEKLHA